MSIPELQRITSEYVDSEDRLRLTGEIDADRTVVLWLSCRLLSRLLPHLFKWLEEQSDRRLPADIVQSFAQQAAKARHTPESAVQRQPDTLSWLVHSVDIKGGKDRLRLNFVAPGQDPLRLTLQTQHLRQWLSIIQTQWIKAGWPMQIWPDWMEISDETGTTTSSQALH